MALVTPVTQLIDGTSALKRHKALVACRIEARNRSAEEKRHERVVSHAYGSTDVRSPRAP